MNLGNYIHRLLLDNEMVIIPGFGAFVTKYKPAEINNEYGTILPPSRTVTFHSNIRNNDGLLVGYIAGTLGISHFDALKWIEKERDKLFYQLDKEGSITLADMGVLSFSEDHEICFVPWDEENLRLDAYGLNAVSMNPEEIQDLPIRETGEETAFDSSADTLRQTENEPDTEELNTGTATTVASEIELNTPHREGFPVAEGRKGKNHWGYLFILLPIIASGIFILYKNGITGTDKPAEKLIPDIKLSGTPQPLDTLLTRGTVSVTVQDSLAADTAAAKVSQTYKEVTLKYVLVGGSFRDKENAEIYMQQLTKEGFQPFHLGKRGNFFIVGIGRYPTEKEAVAARDGYVDKNPGSGVWVMKDEP